MSAESPPRAPSEETRQIFPFIRTPLRLYHVLPIIGPIVYLVQDHRLMVHTVNEIDMAENRNPLYRDAITIGVSSWPEPRNDQEWLQHIKTQAVHGLMGGYLIASSAVLVALSR